MRGSKATKRIAAIALVAVLGILPFRGLIPAGVFLGYAKSYGITLDLAQGDLIVDDNGIYIDGDQDNAWTDLTQPVLVVNSGGSGNIHVFDSDYDADVQLVLGYSSHVDSLNLYDDSAPRVTVLGKNSIDSIFYDSESANLTLYSDENDEGIPPRLTVGSVETEGDFRPNIDAYIDKILHIDSNGNLDVHIHKTGSGDLFLSNIQDPIVTVEDGQLIFDSSEPSFLGGWIEVLPEGSLVFSADDHISFGGELHGNGKLIKYGGHSLTLSNSGNTFHGSTAVEQGLLAIESDTPALYLGGNIALGESSVLSYNYNGAPDQPLLVGSQITGEGSLVKEGGGAVILTNNNNFTGGTAVEEGKLQLGNDTPTGSVPLNLDVAPSATLAISRSDNLSIDVPFELGGGFEKSGGGTLTLNKKSVFESLALYGGSLIVDESLSVQNAVVGGGSIGLWLNAGNNTPLVVEQSLNLSGGSLQTLGAHHIPFGQTWAVLTAKEINGSFSHYAADASGQDFLVTKFLLADNGVFATKDHAWFAHESIAHGNFTVQDAGHLVLDMELYDVAGENKAFASGWNGKTLTKSGTGTLRLPRPSLYTGGTAIDQGTVIINSLQSLGQGPVVIDSDAKLELDISDSGQLLNEIRGSGSIRQIGSGSVALAGDHTGDGYYYVDNGMMSFSQWNGGIFVADAAVLHIASPNTGIGENLNLYGTLQLGANFPLRVDNAYLESGSVLTVDATGLADGRYLLLEAGRSIRLDKLSLKVSGISDGQKCSYEMNNAGNMLYLVVGDPAQEQESQRPAILFDDGKATKGYRIGRTGDALGADFWPQPQHRDGWAFAGWFTEKKGGGTQYLPTTPVTQDVQLYAHWLPALPDVIAALVDDAAPAEPDESADSEPEATPPAQEENEENIVYQSGWTPIGSANTDEKSFVVDETSPVSASVAASPETTLSVQTRESPAKATYWIEAAEANILYNSTLKAGKESVAVRRTTSSGIRKSALAAMIGVDFQYDSLSGSEVTLRMYVPEPTYATRDILLSGSVSGSGVDKTKDNLAQWFDNNMAVIRLEHQGSFGMPVEVAAQADLGDMDTENLYLYSYDRHTNSYLPIENSDYRIDANGYLRFTTKVGGDIIVSEGPLLKR